MSRPRSSVRRADPAERPLLGALLRLANQVMGQELVRWLAASGHADLQPAHCAAIQALWTRPEGARLTDLAQTARVTKQSMGALVDHLCRAGYAERVGDPDDRRASRVRLTARGRTLTKEVRAFVRGVEADWARRVGARRIRDLQETLAAIVLEPAETP
ncbi:MarR family winged helix-turn-helix transcriptional regulator [Geothrix alkalitolerans]|uniref:MarR family winged helix-turn-helix transcriptional regulator n=1 Tax=Geothrix alkalitolerans TaxID=2922724 RepID=UPI001FAEA859|nr:MarR family winged helix-turn-helix transcriptional regulator [Geothrix alkalitolerans]